MSILAEPRRAPPNTTNPRQIPNPYFNQNSRLIEEVFLIQNPQFPIEILNARIASVFEDAIHASLRFAPWKMGEAISQGANLIRNFKARHRCMVTS